MRKKEVKWDTLEGVLAGIWKMLDRGVSNYHDPFHWPVLGTTGPDGPNMRCVILRGFSRSDRVLVCHTDARAAKVREIARHSGVSWLFYHPKKKVQLRISGQATLHTDDDFADRQWAASRLSSRLNYVAIEPPGTPIDSPSSGWPNFLLHKTPTLLETEKGRGHFAAISCRFDLIDWLVLRLSGNRRARFKWDETGLNANWLIP
jgi:3-hydroxyisobutyrate dehydrogenase